MLLYTLWQFCLSCIVSKWLYISSSSLCLLVAQLSSFIMLNISLKSTLILDVKQMGHAELRD